MVVNPHALVESSSRLRLHSIYYITKQVTPHLMLSVPLLHAASDLMKPECLEFNHAQIACSCLPC